MTRIISLPQHRAGFSVSKIRGQAPEAFATEPGPRGTPACPGTVGSIINRVWADTTAGLDLFDWLRRIGIDEISYKRNYKYLTVVVDHDTGRLVWVAAGRDQATLRAFFGALGPERCALLTHVSADCANWIGDVVAQRCPNAVRCADPFHVVRWATQALDEVRREAWNAARDDVRARRARRAAGLGWRPQGTRKR